MYNNNSLNFILPNLFLTISHSFKVGLAVANGTYLIFSFFSNALVFIFAPIGTLKNTERFLDAVLIKIISASFTCCFHLTINKFCISFRNSISLPRRICAPIELALPDLLSCANCDPPCLRLDVYL